MVHIEAEQEERKRRTNFRECLARIHAMNTKLFYTKFGRRRGWEGNHAHNIKHGCN